MAKDRKTGGRRMGSLNKATLGVKLLGLVLPAEENERAWRKFLNHRGQRIRWEAFKLAQSCLFGEPVQLVTGEQMVSPIKIDISAIPTERIHQIASRHFRGETASFEPSWKRFLVEFHQWTTLFPAQNVSRLNVKVGFLQILLKQLPAPGVLKTDPRVIDLVLADTGCRMVGDKVVDPRFGECEITQRSVGDRSGVLYTMMKTINGSPWSIRRMLPLTAAPF